MLRQHYHPYILRRHHTLLSVDIVDSMDDYAQLLSIEKACRRLRQQTESETRGTSFSINV